MDDSYKIRKNYSKDEIIAMYLNTVPFGYQLYGIKSASLYYFGKDPIDLSLDESAILIGMLKATTKFNPILNPENAKQRRNVVLKQMLKNDYITEEEFNNIKEKDIPKPEKSITSSTDDLAPYFREYLRQYMTAKEPDPKKYKNKADYKKAKERWDNDPLYGWCNKNKNQMAALIICIMMDYASTQLLIVECKDTLRRLYASI